MMNSKHSLFTLTLVVLTFALLSFDVTSNDVMIQDVCSKTPDPDRCQTCLHSDPSSKTADIRELAMISFTCGNRDAYKLYDDTYNVYNSTSPYTAPELRNITGKCYMKFHLAGDYMSADSAGLALTKYGVAAVKEDIDTAMASMTDCSDLLKKNPGVPVPQNIIDEMNGVVTDIQIIYEVLKRIPP